ncbi:hypothetical protein ACFLY9_02110 [Patescibacteria group bacterium]
MCEEEPKNTSELNSKHAHLLIEWTICDDSEEVEAMNQQVETIPLVQAVLQDDTKSLEPEEIRDTLRSEIDYQCGMISEACEREIEEEYNDPTKVNPEELLRFIKSSIHLDVHQILASVRREFSITDLPSSIKINIEYIANHWGDLDYNPEIRLPYSHNTYLLIIGFLSFFALPPSNIKSILEKHPGLFAYMKENIRAKPEVIRGIYSLEDMVIVGKRILLPFLEGNSLQYLDYESLAQRLLDELKHTIPTLGILP